MILGVLLATCRAKRCGLKSDIIFDFVLIAIPVAIICARIYYVAFEWDAYKEDLLSVFKIWEGGLAIYGGVLGGILTAYLFCRHSRFPLFRFLDLAVPSLVLGQAIGRWGNFVNQEAFGNPVTNPSLQFFPYAVYIDTLEQWHQATFFYESIWNVCLLILMLFVGRKKPNAGTLTCMYFVIYGIGRFLIEGLRTDSLYIIPGLRISQLLSLILICVSVIVYLWKASTGKFNQSYSGKYVI